MSTGGSSLDWLVDLAWSSDSGASQTPTQSPGEVIVTSLVRRLALGFLLAAPLASGVILTAGPAAAQSCDPVYTSHCIAPVADAGDLNCDDFSAQGIYGILLADPASDPHRLDGWTSVDDGYGCEGTWGGSAPGAEAASMLDAGTTETPVVSPETVMTGGEDSLTR
jgi:hypothetical protein